MACVPFLSGGKQYRFEAIVKIHSLISVPYVNAVTFVKLRLLNSRHSSQYSPRAEVRNHTVTWNSEHKFVCKFHGNTETPTLEPKVLKISVRMETKGGKSFRKVGYVSVDLACFTGLGNATSRRRYILEGYDVKHKRLDNSLLLVSFSMRQLLGDACFRPPAENLSNCIIQPPDSDEAEASNFVKHNTSPVNPHLPIAATNTTSSLLLPQVATHPNEPSSSIDRILESIHSISTDVYSHPPSRPNSAMSIALNVCPTSPTNVLPSPPLLHPVSDRRQPLFQQHGSAALTSERLATLLSDVLHSSHSSSTRVAPSSCECSRNFSGTELTIPSHGTINHSAHCQVACSPLAPVSTASRSRGSSLSIPARFDLGESAHPGGPVAGSQPLLIHPSNSTSVSSTPGSATLDGTLVNSQSSDNQSRSQQTTSLLADTLRNDAASRLPCPVLVGRVDIESIPISLDTFDNSFCHSLPLPAHYSARHRCDMPFTSVSPPHPPYPDYFATDSGLLLPSRRRKLRPMADYAFPLSHIRTPFEAADNSGLSSAYASKSDVIPELQPEQHHRCTDQPIDASLISCVSTAGDGHSSGYQSHSRQSSLESQTVTVHCASPLTTQYASGLAVTASGSKADVVLKEMSPPS